MEIVEDVIVRLGGVSAAARALGVTHPTIIGWRARARIPAEKVMAVSELTGIAPAKLRPDLAKLFEAA